MSESCLFCRIVEGEIPADIVSTSDVGIAFRDINPQAPVHVLVVPRQHIPSLAVADDGEALGALMLFAARVAKEQGLADSGYRTVLNTGNDGGQTVDHLHVHLLGGRSLKWPPG